jgi:NADPH-dependent 2,4-dienoyl-CoA reductase/sulfur reductase-like enzyme
VGVLIGDKSYFVSADKLVLATGAQERPMPIQGWELPGVMAAGAGQILLKSAGMVAWSPTAGCCWLDRGL